MYGADLHTLEVGSGFPCVKNNANSKEHEVCWLKQFFFVKIFNFQFSIFLNQAIFEFKMEPKQHI
jgi:hypothetical protein